MRSGIPQGLGLGLVPFNIVGKMDSGIECTLSRLADDTKLSGEVDTVDGRDAIQRDVNWLQNRVHDNLMKFSKAKCKVLHLGWGKAQVQVGWWNGLRTALRKIWGCRLMKYST